MRTFQFSDAKSHKFWNIDVQGTSFTVTYGKIGTAGQTQTKTFATAEKAQAEADKLIKEKTGKGYVETTAKAAVSDAEALERAVLANPNEITAISAYADYLTEHEDPRGEFMQIQIALENESLPKVERKKLQASEKALLKKHESEWLGTLAPMLIDQAEPKHKHRPSTINYRFRRGWLAELEVPRLGVEFARKLVQCKEARFLQSLHIHSTAYEFPSNSPNISQYADGTYEPGPDIPEDAGNENPSFHILAKFPYFSSVRVFHLGNPITEDYKDSDQCHTDGEMAYHLLKQMPNVEEIYLLAHQVDTSKLFALKMPSLRILQVFHASNYPLDKLAENTSLANLTHLLLQPHAPDEEHPYIRLRELRAVCRSRNLPKLTHLAMRFTDFGDDGVREIIDSGLLKRLKVLDLEGGCVTYEGAKVLAYCPDFKRLERVNLDINALGPAGISLFEATKVPVSTKQQHNSVPPFEDEMPEYLFYADIE